MARGKYWISTMLATAISAALVPQFLFAQPIAASTADASQIQQSLATLSGTNATVDQRQGAAKGLVSLHTSQSRSVVSSVLVDLRFPLSQLAMARALADDPDPQQEFINPLIALLDDSQRSPVLGNAAAEALGTYKSNTNVLTNLIDHASGSDQTNRNLAIRIAAIRGLGLMCDKAAANTLINLLTSTSEPQEIRNPAADALATLSGETLGHDVQAWQQWWDQNRGKSDPKFRDDLLTARAAQFDAIQRRHTDLEQNFKDFLDSEYQHAVATERGAKPQSSEEMLQSYLVSSNPIVRAEAAVLILQDKNQGNPVPTAARDQLRKMVDDSDPGVRLAVAAALYSLNDHDALAPVLKQLDHEQDPAVRAALISILGPIGDLSAIPQLRKGLDDAPIVAEQAANALVPLAGKLRVSNPDAIRPIGRQLQAVLDRTKDSDTNKLRESIVAAMAALHDPALEPTFEKILNNPNESPSVQTQAVVGIGYIGNPKYADLIIPSLNDKDPSVRMATVDALKSLDDGTNTASIAPQLVKMLKPGADNPAVQVKAWETLASFLPELDGNQLQDFADSFRDYHDPAKRVAVLRAKFAKDTKAGNSDDQAATLQNIGESLMDDQLKQYDEAAEKFEAAITVYSGLPATNKTILSNLVQLKTKALLLAGKYDDAMQYAATSIKKDPSQTTEIADLIVHEADDLSSEGEQNSPSLDKALQLIAAAKNNLTLPQNYQAHLEQTESDVRKAQAKNKGSGSTLSTPGSNGATARTTD